MVQTSDAKPDASPLRHKSPIVKSILRSDVRDSNLRNSSQRDANLRSSAHREPTIKDLTPIVSSNAKPLPHPTSFHDSQNGLLNQRFTFRKSSQNFGDDLKPNETVGNDRHQSNSLRRKKSTGSDDRQMHPMSASRSPVRDTLGSLNFRGVNTAQRSGGGAGNTSERDAIHER